ncbi:MAG: EamA family transporter [Janthinobacterium lividum]
MKHRLKTSQYALLVAIMLTASLGDTLLSRGMAQIGPVNLQHLGLLWHALGNGYVMVGIVLLIGFFASYTAALSWADLTFVMPATAFGYVVVALLSRIWLHERLSGYRWAGILLIVCAVGFVADGPSKTEHPSELDTEASHPHSVPELAVMDAGAGR